MALVNLVCAEGLPGAQGLNIPRCLTTLDRWADSVRRYTRDGRGEYQVRPDAYQCHKGVFAFVSMATLLKHPNGVGASYQPTAVGNYDFRDSRDDLLHGLLTRRLGTCSSFPVLFVAIGRRLGYPIHLAIAKGHVLCQWVDDRGRVNLEPSCRGSGVVYPDEYYHGWPHRMSPTDVASGRYLRPLTRAEELALFLETRGHCLTDNGRFDDARRVYEHAHRVAPHWSAFDDHMLSLSLHADRARLSCRGPSVMSCPAQTWHTASDASILCGAPLPSVISLPGFTG